MNRRWSNTAFTNNTGAIRLTQHRRLGAFADEEIYGSRSQLAQDSRKNNVHHGTLSSEDNPAGGRKIRKRRFAEIARDVCLKTRDIKDVLRTAQIDKQRYRSSHACTRLVQWNSQCAWCFMFDPSNFAWLTFISSPSMSTNLNASHDSDKPKRAEKGTSLESGAFG